MFKGGGSKVDGPQISAAHRGRKVKSGRTEARFRRLYAAHHHHLPILLPETVIHVTTFRTKARSVTPAAKFSDHGCHPLARVCLVITCVRQCLVVPVCYS